MKEELGLILSGKTVLITGGGGTVGTEIAHQVIKWKPDLIVCLGRSKKKLVDVVVNTQKINPNVHVDIDLCDITDRGRIDEVFSKYTFAPGKDEESNLSLTLKKLLNALAAQ